MGFVHSLTRQTGRASTAFCESVCLKSTLRRRHRGDALASEDPNQALGVLRRAEGHSGPPAASPAPEARRPVRPSGPSPGRAISILSREPVGVDDRRNAAVPYEPCTWAETNSLDVLLIGCAGRELLARSLAENRASAADEAQFLKSGNRELPQLGGKLEVVR